MKIILINVEFLNIYHLTKPSPYGDALIWFLNALIWITSNTFESTAKMAFY